MTARLTWHQQYRGGRIVARLGQIEVGAVFPDQDTAMGKAATEADAKAECERMEGNS